MTPTISVVVATRDRPEHVGPCLDDLVRHAAGGELVMVDNHPVPVVEPPPGVRLVHEPVQGVARARNRGVAATTGVVVAFVDDDVRVGAGWLSALTAPFADPGVVATVGGLVLDLDGPRPAWLTPNLEHWYSALDLGPVARPLGAGEYGWGANLAVRRSALAAVGGFDDRLGPGRPIAYGDDTEVLDRLRSAGGTVVYVPAATVRHVVGADRLTLRWLVRRAWLAGRTEVAVAALHRPGPRRRRPLRALRSLAGALRWGLPALWRSLRDPARRRSLVVEQVVIWAAKAGAAGAHWSRAT